MKELNLFDNEGTAPIIREINPRAERINTLKRTEHIFYNDPGHAWMEVKYSDIVMLGINKEISGYSYRSGDLVYLEEDRDAGIYLNAIFPDALNNQEFKQFRDLYIKDRYIEDNIFIRDLRHYYQERSAI